MRCDGQVTSHVPSTDLTCCFTAPHSVSCKVFRPKPGNKVGAIFTRDQEAVFLHPGSVNFNKVSEALAAGSGSVSGGVAGWLCYHSCVKTSKAFIHDSTFVGKYAILLFGGDMAITGDRDKVVIDKWIGLKMPEGGAVLCKALRQVFTPPPTFCRLFQITGSRLPYFSYTPLRGWSGIEFFAHS